MRTAEGETPNGKRLVVGDAVGLAMARAEAVLFKPRIRKKWLAIAAAAWLAEVNEWNGLGAGFEYAGREVWQFIRNPEEAAKWINEHRWPMMGWMLAAVVVLFFVYLAFRWVSCRGQFMMLDATVHNGISVRESWRRHQKLGNSLLRFRIGWDLAIFNMFLLVAVIAGVLEWMDVRVLLDGETYRMTDWSGAAIAVGAAGGLVAAVVAWLGTLFVDTFMVPVMYVRGMEARAAFRHALRAMFWPRRKACLLYLLMMQLTGMIREAAASAGTILVILATCGIALGLMAVPILSLAPLFPIVLVALPVEVYGRAYSLYFLEQFGGEYRVQWKA